MKKTKPKHTKRSNLTSKKTGQDSWYRLLSNILVLSGGVGLLSSLVLTFDKLKVLTDSSYVPDCSINPILSCVSVMQSTQSEILGFPNQIVGIIAFSVFISVGVLMRFTKSFDGILWRLLTLGTLLGFAVIHWLVFQSLYVLGALCLWCMLTWAAFAPLAWYSLLFSLKNNYISVPDSLKSTKDFAIKNHYMILVTWYLIVVGLILEKFWYYWETLI